MKPIEIEIESTPGTAVVSSHWKTIAIRDLMPRAGIIGWLGRKLNKRWGYVWVERILAPGEQITADEINLQIKKGLPW